MDGMRTPATDLIRAMAAGDHEAFARFYDRYASLVFPLVLRIVGERAAAADVLQDVFWEAWRTAAAYDRARGTPQAWIVTCARTRVIDRVRAMRRRGETIVAPLDPAAADALARLPAPQREVIELAYYAGLTQREIAALMEQPLASLQTRIRLAVARLRELVTLP
jgi:RNA polymerase sigma-70 factor (ECF subfamily)